MLGSQFGIAVLHLIGSNIVKVFLVTVSMSSYMQGDGQQALQGEQAWLCSSRNGRLKYTAAQHMRESTCDTVDKQCKPFQQEL